jgi:DNA-binding transcriptional MerR regulator
VPTDFPYSISDLAGLTGLSVRTIRYYLAQGLIPASGESGPGAHYGEGHLGRLRLVRRLQQQHLPLAEIRSRLAALTDAEVLALTTVEPVAEPATSALDYVRSVLAGSSRGDATPHALPRQPAAPAAPAAPIAAPAAAMPARRDDMATSMPAAPGPPNRFLRRMAAPFIAEARTIAAEPALPLASAKLPPSIASAPEPAAADPEPAPQSIERSQWERLSLGPDLELHIRRPLGRLEQKRVERLITIARQVLKEERP